MPTPPRRPRRRGFTLIDLMLALAVLAIMMVVVVPSAQPDEQVKLLAAATRLAADVEYAQSASLSTPGDPTVVRFAADGSGYWLALKSAADTPILIPNSDEPFHVIFGKGDARGLEGMTAGLTAKDADTIEFDAFGRLTETDDASIKLENTAGATYVSVKATTGSVNILGQAPSK